MFVGIPCVLRSAIPIDDKLPPYFVAIDPAPFSLFLSFFFFPLRVRPGAKVGAELKPLTVASSPSFSTKRRSALRSNSLGGAEILTSEETELEKAAAKKFRARPMPDYAQVCI